MARKERGHDKPHFVCFKEKHTTKEDRRKKEQEAKAIKEGKRAKREADERNAKLGH
jgi:hypothetical protein